MPRGIYKRKKPSSGKVPFGLYSTAKRLKAAIRRRVQEGGDLEEVEILGTVLANKIMGGEK